MSTMPNVISSSWISYLGESDTPTTISGCINGPLIRDCERVSIRGFMTRHRQYLKGRVLDYGSGKQPYKDLVEGEYFPYDPAYHPATYNDLLMLDPSEHAPYDAIMCNQVIQYEQEPDYLIDQCATNLKQGGYLVMTYPTNWDEVTGDDDDYFRFTKKGMEYLLANADLLEKDAKFTILHHTLRASISFPGFSFPLGYGVVAQRL
jgi:SAM-dependent methyltransferase